MSVRSIVQRLRQPAYTGANRCLPCTVVNLVVVAGGAVLAGLLAPVAGAVVAVLGVGAVWLRGYVVPGTPTLTRRYLPEPVLALFGKSPAPGEPPEGDPTEKLAALGVVAGEEPALTRGFRAEWADRAADIAVDDAALRTTAGEVLSADPDAVALTHPEEGGVALEVDGSWVGGWPSRTALAADLATERTLAGDAWAGLDRLERVDLAARIRGLADRCPACGTGTTVSEDTVTSCCGSAEVVAVSCPGCEARLAEFDPSPQAFAPGR
jgi:hypothetical protein